LCTEINIIDTPPPHKKKREKKREERREEEKKIRWMRRKNRPVDCI
jgi:hypothetical protein